MAAKAKLSQCSFFFSFFPSYSTFLRFFLYSLHMENIFSYVFLKRFHNYLTTENCNLVVITNWAEDGRENNGFAVNGDCERRRQSYHVWKKENSRLFPSSYHKLYRNVCYVLLFVRHTSNKKWCAFDDIRDDMAVGRTSNWSWHQ